MTAGVRSQKSGVRFRELASSDPILVSRGASSRRVRLRLSTKTKAASEPACGYRHLSAQHSVWRGAKRLGVRRLDPALALLLDADLGARQAAAFDLG
jgi:hypothetical protein